MTEQPMTRQPMTRQPAPAIRVRGLEKSYKQKKEKLRVLRGVDFDVPRGSILALLGSNGAGKTTVVNILSTLLAADAGTVTVNGFDVAAQGASVRQSISLTGQFAAVDEILTGRENVVLAARLRHLKGAGRIADDLLARFRLADAAGRRVSTYSGGMRRRLDIAMSLTGNPPVIFLDEPTAGLDPQARIEVWQMVKELEYRHRTITDTYLTEPDRGRVLVAKLVVYAGLGAITGLVSAGVAVATTAIWWSVKGGTLALSTGVAWSTILGGAAVNPAFAMIGVGVGALVRNLVVAIAGALAWIALIEGIASQLIGPDLARWLPFAASEALGRTSTSSLSLPQWAGGLVLLGYTAAFAVAALLTTLTRDVT